MSTTSIPQGLFKTRSSKAETKATTTDQISRAIIDEETARREAKTAKLRAARLARESLEDTAAEPGGEPVAKRVRKAAGPRAVVPRAVASKTTAKPAAKRKT